MSELLDKLKYQATVEENIWLMPKQITLECIYYIESLEEKVRAYEQALEKYERWLCPHGEPIGKLAREVLAKHRKTQT